MKLKDALYITAFAGLTAMILFQHVQLWRVAIAQRQSVEFDKRSVERDQQLLERDQQLLAAIGRQIVFDSNSLVLLKSIEGRMPIRSLFAERFIEDLITDTQTVQLPPDKP